MVVKGCVVTVSKVVTKVVAMETYQHAHHHGNNAEWRAAA